MISVKYLPYFSKCRLGNQLYFALNVHKYRRSLNNDVTQDINRELAKLFNTINIKNYVIDGYKSISPYLLPRNNPGIASMFQEFGTCYTEELLNDFISKTIIESEKIKTCQKINDRLCVQIRGGDYRTAPQGFQFDGKSFLHEALKVFNNDFNGIDIFSDDEFYVDEYFMDTLKTCSDNIIFNKCSDPATDLIKSALYRKKIIWNSTYAYWSAYISNVVFKDNHEEIVAPLSFAKNVGNGKSFHLNPRWTILNY